MGVCSLGLEFKKYINSYFSGLRYFLNYNPSLFIWTDKYRHIYQTWLIFSYTAVIFINILYIKPISVSEMNQTYQLDISHSEKNPQYEKIDEISKWHLKIQIKMFIQVESLS